MRKLAPLVLIPLLLTGCGRSSVPGAAVGAEPVPQLAPAVPTAAPVALETFEGQTADQWSNQLGHPSPEVRQRAATALGAVKGGAAHLVQGMRSNSADTQLHCLQAIYKQDMLDRRQETLPLVVGMLRHRDDQLRLSAVTRAAWFGKNAQPAVPLLQHMMANDPSPEIRIAAKESLYFINVATTGQQPGHTLR